MTVPANTNALLLNSAAPVGYQISRSLRFNSADSAYLNRTPGSAGSRTTWTWSAWIKRSKLGAAQEIWGAYTGTGNDEGLFYATFESDDKLYIYGWFSLFRKTTQVFRDVSAWYHIVIVADVTNGTANNRLRIYVNGTEITTFDTITNPASTSQFAINSASAHYIGADPYSPSSRKGDYMLADVYLLDGTATTPSTFAETDAITGQWVPKTPTGISYGTNGFRLPFSDNSGTTSTTLGKDSAGSNNWTPNNFSVASGSGNDSLVDTPTSYGTDTYVGGEVRGNYATWNPLANNGGTLSNGNYDHSGTTALTAGTLFSPSGKWYFEVTCNTYSGGFGGAAVGVIKSDQSVSTVPNSIATVPSGLWLYRNDAYKINNGAASASYGNTWTAGDVIGVAFDVDAGKLWFAKNGTWQASGDPAAGTNAAYTNLSGSIGVAINDQGNTTTYSLNTGARAFAYTAPSGFKALCDTNLTAPTIAKPADYFDAKLYTGNGSTLTVSGLNFGPELVWIKSRSNAYDHGLYDAVRGTTKRLVSNDTQAEDTQSGITAFNSDGFTLGSYAGQNGSSATYVAWAWDAASSNTTNTSGTITSTVRANATAGFSIVTYTGNGSAATVGHGLNALPSFFVIKNRSGSPAANNWYVGHTSITWTKVLTLNTTDAASTGSDWTPTSTLLTIPSGLSSNGIDYVAYCFAPVAGYSAFGSYTGNGSSDGPFVFCNFRPRYLMVKASSTGGSYYYWYVFDSVRDTANPTDLMLFPNVSDAESSTYDFDFLANGFKVRTNAIYVNNSAVTYIYAAFAESPFQYARAR